MVAAPDEAVVRRIVRRAGAYLEQGAIRADLLHGLFEMFRADETVRQAVTAGLTRTGVAIVGDPNPNAESAAQTPPEGEAQTTDPGPNGIQRPAARPAPVDARDAGLAVLERDRRQRAPWKRILTAEQEVGLCTLMREPGQPLGTPLPKGFRKTLDSTDVRAAAFDAMYLHNRGLVWSLTSRFAGHGLDPEDLEQSGYEGLRRAIELFDGSRGLKFSTYATHWINQATSRAVANDGRLIRLPVHMHERMQRVLATRNRLLVETGRAPLFDLCASTELRPEQVIECLRLSAGVASVDAPVGEDTSLLELLAAEVDPDADPMGLILRSEFRDDVNVVLGVMNEREEAILRMRFGFETDEPMTLDAIGQTLGVTRERIRQIEKKAKERFGALFADAFPDLVPASQPDPAGITATASSPDGHAPDR